MSAAEKLKDDEFKVVELMNSRVQPAETMRNVFQVCVEPNTPKEALKEPSYWKHVASRLEPYTRLEVVTDDNEYYAEFLVLDSGSNWALVKELLFIELNDKQIIQEAEKQIAFEIAYKGPHRKFAVLRKEDGEIIKDGFQKKEQAATFLQEYVKVINK